jgi:cardiolipin hydrolase
MVRRTKMALLCVVFLVALTATASAQCTVESYFSPYDDIQTAVVKRLSEATTSVNCSLYGITNISVTKTLKGLVDKGVTVKLCLDKTQSAGKYDTHQQLADAGVEVVIKKTGVLEHNKFCVIDGSRVIMGSWNYSNNAQKQDNSMVDLSGCDAIVKQFSDAFERIYERDK